MTRLMIFFDFDFGSEAFVDKHAFVLFAFAGELLFASSQAIFD